MILSISAVSTSIKNVELGTGPVGSSGSYSSLSNAAKIVLSFDMRAGRLELFTVLSLFISSFWRKRGNHKKAIINYWKINKSLLKDFYMD